MEKIRSVPYDEDRGLPYKRRSGWDDDGAFFYPMPYPKCVRNAFIFFENKNHAEKNFLEFSALFGERIMWRTIDSNGRYVFYVAA